MGRESLARPLVLASKVDLTRGRGTLKLNLEALLGVARVTNHFCGHTLGRRMHTRILP